MTTRSRGSCSLPARSRDIEISYTALSLAVPEKVRFRYRLDGRDQEWNDAGTRRQAFYSDLPPGRVSIPGHRLEQRRRVERSRARRSPSSSRPRITRRGGFSPLIAGAVLTAAWAAHRVRMRIVERNQRDMSALNERLMKAQEQERVRIAGELHDGVMQEMLAATMMLGTAKRRTPMIRRRTATIDKVQQKLIRMGTDLRQLSHELHPPALQEAGLPKAVQDYCEEFSTASGIPVSCDTDPGVDDLSRAHRWHCSGSSRRHSATPPSTRRPRGSPFAWRETPAWCRWSSPTTASVSIQPAGPVTRVGTDYDPRAGGTAGREVRVRHRPGRGTTIKVVIPFR